MEPQRSRNMAQNTIYNINIQQNVAQHFAIYLGENLFWGLEN